ncbi:MAG: response regulator, partial [Xanthobacteraceae bacterium]
MAEETASFANALSGEIFVVDDDAAIRDLLAMLLSRRGYKVAGFADGPSLIAAMRTQSPACILLDVHIPGKSGLDILKELSARNHPAPVIIISGKGDIAMAATPSKAARSPASTTEARPTSVVSPWASVRSEHFTASDCSAAAKVGKSSCQR